MKRFFGLLAIVLTGFLAGCSVQPITGPKNDSSWSSLAGDVRTQLGPTGATRSPGTPDKRDGPNSKNTSWGKLKIMYQDPTPPPNQKKE